VPKSIVVAEDSPTQRSLLKLWLEPAGYDLTMCANGQEAFERVRSAPTDLVVSDINMPVMDGLTFCRKVRAEPSLADLPLILFTKMDDAVDVLAGLEAGADAFVVKGNSEKLLERISAALGDIGSGTRSSRTGAAKGIADRLSLTSGRRDIFKVLFDALSREIWVDVLALVFSSSDGEKMAVIVSRKRLAETLVTELVEETAAMVNQLGGEPFPTAQIARETIVFDEAAAPEPRTAKPENGVRVPLIDGGVPFGAFAVYAFDEASQFADNMRFFFDAGVASARALRRVSLRK
jgi:CheY-like chemotaxis protein